MKTLYARMLRGAPPESVRSIILNSRRYVVGLNSDTDKEDFPGLLHDIVPVGEMWWMEPQVDIPHGNVAYCVHVPAPGSMLIHAASEVFGRVSMRRLRITLEGCGNYRTVARDLDRRGRELPPSPAMDNWTIEMSRRCASMVRTALDHLPDIVRLSGAVSRIVERGKARRELDHVVIQPNTINLAAERIERARREAAEAEERRRNRLHGVRTHIRRYKRSGRIIQVKAHVRGSEEAGIIIRPHTEVRT